MAGRTLKDIEESRVRQRQGLTGRALAGCFSLFVSLGAAYLVYGWIGERKLRRLLVIPTDWPDPVVQILFVLLLFILIQAMFILLGGVVWKLTGRDKKVRDKMRDLYDQWDEH